MRGSSVSILEVDTHPSGAISALPCPLDTSSRTQAECYEVDLVTLPVVKTHHIVSLKDDFMAAVRCWGHCWLRPPKEMKYKGRKILSYTIFWAFFALVVAHSVVSDSLWPQGLQHARLPCPSSSPGANLNSCSLSRWCHPTISSSVVPFSSCFQSFPAPGSFLIS